MGAEQGAEAMNRALREAGIYLAACAGIAAVSAWAWVALFDGRYRSHFGICLVVLAGLLPMTGAQLLTKTSMADKNAWLGLDPRSENMHEGVLTSLGIFLFVSIPLALFGMLLG